MKPEACGYCQAIHKGERVKEVAMPLSIAVHEALSHKPNQTNVVIGRYITIGDKEKLYKFLWEHKELFPEINFKDV
jgi:hypothetical protein